MSGHLVEALRNEAMWFEGRNQDLANFASRLADALTPTVFWQVLWAHPNGRDKCCGEEWPDRESADYAAEAVERGGMLNVRVVRCFRGPEPKVEDL